MRRNRLRQFGHVNRMKHDNNQISLLKTGEETSETDKWRQIINKNTQDIKNIIITYKDKEYYLNLRGG